MFPTEVPGHILSKSTFMRGCQCVKSLWLHKYMPGEKDEVSETQSAIFLRGTDVGALARDIFPGGVDASPVDAFHYQQSVLDTAAYIREGHTIIYEAAFQYEGVMAALDILVKQNGKWYGYEVKSSTKLKDPFIQDAALEYYVITGSGIALEDLYIVHLNNEYVRKGLLDLQQLFTRQSVKAEVISLQPVIQSKVEELKKVIQLNEMPAVVIGDHCNKPYTCDFYSFCRKDEQEVKEEEEEAIINKQTLRSFINQLEYPLYFMDFETYMLAVPEHDGHWPYRQVPFQYSVHKQMRANDPLEHHCFLAENNRDPCPEFVQSLVNTMGERGSVVIYNKAFENTRLNELREDYPQFAGAIENIQSRMVDLMVPFRSRHYSLPAMQGSYSIKYVLPALVPELSYEGLSICNGADASSAFYNLRFEENQEKINETRKALLDYCELDTLAMVRILENIRKVMV